MTVVDQCTVISIQVVTANMVTTKAFSVWTEVTVQNRKELFLPDKGIATYTDTHINID